MMNIKQISKPSILKRIALSVADNGFVIIYGKNLQIKKSWVNSNKCQDLMDNKTRHIYKHL